MLETGQSAPDFSLADQDGKIHNLADYRGQVVSYLVSPDGVIIRSYPEVDPANHALEILKDLGG